MNKKLDTNEKHVLSISVVYMICHDFRAVILMQYSGCDAV